MTGEGLVTLRSASTHQTTITKLEAEINAKGMTIFTHIDHTAGATAAGLNLRPTDLFIFGDARGGTPLMQAAQTIGLDLPLRALVWQDRAGNSWISYDDPNWLAKRHGLNSEMHPAANILATAIDIIVRAATS